MWQERRLNPDEQIEYTAASLVTGIHKVAAPDSVLWREGLLETDEAYVLTDNSASPPEHTNALQENGAGRP